MKIACACIAHAPCAKFRVVTPGAAESESHFNGFDSDSGVGNFLSTPIPTRGLTPAVFSSVLIYLPGVRG